MVVGSLSLDKEEEETLDIFGLNVSNQVSAFSYFDTYIRIGVTINNCYASHCILFPGVSHVIPPSCRVFK